MELRLRKEEFKPSEKKYFGSDDQYAEGGERFVDAGVEGGQTKGNNEHI